MRLRHFETLRPVCPVCRGTSPTGIPLRLASVQREESAVIEEGILACSNPQCQHEYPILDGLPLILPGLRSFVADNIATLHAREDLGNHVESLLGDCCGPGSPFDVVRQWLSSYGWDHYADLDPQEIIGLPRPGALRRVLDHGLTLSGPLRAGPILDIGCSVGRSSFALAERTGDLVLGIDVNVAMLRMARRVLRTGMVRYSRRRVGLVYDRREFPGNFRRTENVDFWLCDATALPFPQGTFGSAVGFNVLDSIRSPADLLYSLANALAPGGKAILACPYDWSPSATPLEAWLGGHSQRSQTAGACEPVLRALLTPGAHPASVAGLVLRAEADDLDWHVRLHERSTMLYRLHMVIAERPGRLEEGDR